MKPARKPFSVRLPVSLEARITALASEHDTSTSAITRLALQRGLAAMEREATSAVSPPPRGAPPAASPAASAPRRRGMLSRGIG
jgi:hypothetical protein